MSQKTLDHLLQLNRRNSELYCAGTQRLLEYRREHPTALMATLCMDGRVSWQELTGLPMGLCRLVRNIGGKYEMGWPLMQSTISEWAHEAHKRYAHALLMITYHFSKGDEHLGCAGFSYRTDEAYAHMIRFQSQVRYCCGDRIFPVIVGIETDADAFVIHGEDDQKFDTAQYIGVTDDAVLLQEMRRLFPSAPQQVLIDFVPLVRGNIEHTRRVCQTQRPVVQLDHGENVVVVGRGVDWITKPNIALVVGVCDPDLRRAVTVAASIVQQNLQKGRIRKDQGGVLLTCWPYYDRRIDRKGAILQAQYLHSFARRCIEQPNGTDLSLVSGGFFTSVATILNMETRLLEVLE
jgi:hypothetical protein